MKEQMEVLECKIESKRNTRIPATFTYPKERESFPLILAAHGFQSSRHEYGMYTKVSERMAEAGIGVMRFDFPGNHESTEPMMAYTPANNLDDMESVMEFTRKNWKIENGKTGILGWSMGGCMASLFSRRHPEIQAMALWAPALCSIDVVQGMGGREHYVETLERAGKNGHCKIELEWCSCDLSGEFLQEMLCLNPFEAIYAYKGSLFLAAGMKDGVVDAQKVRLGAAMAVNAQRVETCWFENGDHDFGTAYGRGKGEPRIAEKLLEDTCNFFVSALGK